MTKSQKIPLSGIILLLISLTYLFGSGTPLPFHTADEKLELKRIEKPPRIDGAFEEEIYAEFLKVGNFFQVFPNYEKPASEKTEVFLAYDEDNLFITVKAFMQNKNSIRASICKRDAIDNDDNIEIILDPFMTHVRGYSFAVNPFGVQRDGIFDQVNNPSGPDTSWDTQFFSCGKIYDWGYLVEIKIPFKSFRFPAHKIISSWGFHISRTIADKSELDYLFYYNRNDRNLMSYEGTISLEGNLTKNLHLELIPYITMLKNKGENLKTRTGISFKYGITSDITLDATANPDFSHIEADDRQIDINERYALVYEEKRSFFLEGNEIYLSLLDLFYSRRIAKPKFGAKLTGRSGKSVFGFISTYDTASFRNLKDIHNGTEEALGNVFRYKYEFKKENYIGFFLTDRRGEDRTYNNILSIDGHFKHKNIYWDFQTAVSNSKYEQKSNGNAFFGSLSYADGHLLAVAYTEQYSPDFDAQLGFINRTDIKRYKGKLEYSFLPGKTYLYKYGPRLHYEYITDWNNTLQEKTLSLYFIARSVKNTTLTGAYTRKYEVYNNKGYDIDKWGIRLSSYPFKFLLVSSGFEWADNIYYYGTPPFLGYVHRMDMRATFIPTPRLTAETAWQNEYFYENKDKTNQVYKINIFDIKASYLFTPSLSLRTIWEYEDYSKTHYGNILLAYEYTPGTVLYLGYSSNLRDELGRLVNDSYSLYFKISYLFRQ